jgi:adenosylmethionine-8-amino-7-oxononanoate aminotransferase
MFGAQRYGYEPVYEPFATGATTFMHGYTFGGHPVSLRGRPGESRDL